MSSCVWLSARICPRSYGWMGMVSAAPQGRGTLDHPCATVGAARKGRHMGQYETLDVAGRAVRHYIAGDVTPGAPGVVVLHAWWGLNDDVIAYADRLAAAGFAVVAPDMFGGQVASTIEEAERLSSSAEAP